MRKTRGMLAEKSKGPKTFRDWLDEVLPRGSRGVRARARACVCVVVPAAVVKCKRGRRSSRRHCIADARGWPHTGEWQGIGRPGAWCASVHLWASEHHGLALPGVIRLP